jgi:hypothetical protein
MPGVSFDRFDVVVVPSPFTKRDAHGVTDAFARLFGLNAAGRPDGGKLAVWAIARAASHAHFPRC